MIEGFFRHFFGVGLRAAPALREPCESGLGPEGLLEVARPGPASRGGRSRRLVPRHVEHRSHGQRRQPVASFRPLKPASRTVSRRHLALRPDFQSHDRERAAPYGAFDNPVAMRFHSCGDGRGRRALLPTSRMVLAPAEALWAGSAGADGVGGGVTRGSIRAWWSLAAPIVQMWPPVC